MGDRQGVGNTTSTVKRLIIGGDLFGEIGEIINFNKISSHQLKKIWTPTTFFQ